MGLKSRNSAALTELVAREEWDFTSVIAGKDSYVGCPDDQFEECKVYECARRTPFWRAVFCVVSPDANVSNPTISPTPWTHIYKFLALFSEFPATPWVKIDGAKRRELLAKFVQRGIDQTPIREVEPSDEERAQEMGESTVGVQEDMPAWEDGHEILRRYKQANYYLDDTFHTFRICWEHSSSTLGEAFAKWADEHRPQKAVKFSKSGKHSVRKDSLRDDLRAIGAWTLLHDLKVKKQFTIEQLIEKTAAILPPGKDATKPLYAFRQGWTDAKARAEKTIDCVVPRQLAISLGHSVDPAILKEGRKAIAIGVRNGHIHFARREKR